MAPRPTVSVEQRRLRRITGLMSLASVSNLASVLGTEARSIRWMLNRLLQEGWLWSVRRGMTEALAAAVVSDPSGGGPALRQRPRASGAPGESPSRAAGGLQCAPAGRLLPRRAGYGLDV